MPMEQQYGWGWMHNMMGGEWLGMGFWMWLLILLAVIVLGVAIYALYQVDRGGNRFAAASMIPTPTAPPTPENQPDSAPLQAIQNQMQGEDSPAPDSRPPTPPSWQREVETPMEILQKRYARGEITRDEYEKMRIDLS